MTDSSSRPDSRATAHKERVRAQFAGSAEAYIVSPGHAAGDDLAALTAWAAATAPRRDALDIATGGGHTALALSARFDRVVAADLTPRMIATAATFIGGRGAANVTFACADAERLPFAAGAFDLVSCRIAPHHFGDVPAFVRETARVLRPGGHFLLIDNVSPEDPDLDAFLHRAEVLRDPTHHRSLTVTQWRDLFAAAGLDVEEERIFAKTHPFASWLTRARVPADRQALLDEHFRHASPAAREAFAITIDQDGQIVSYGSRAVLLKGRKTG
jgi:SAM-dependent methyltransferase